MRLDQSCTKISIEAVSTDVSVGISASEGAHTDVHTHELWESDGKRATTRPDVLRSSIA